LEKFSRNYSAHYLYDGKGKEFKFGVLEVDYPEMIAISGSNQPKELRNMKFFNGILFPELSCKLSYLSSQTATSSRHLIVHHQTEILQIILHHLQSQEDTTTSWTNILKELQSLFPDLPFPVWIETFSAFKLEPGRLGNVQLWWIESFDFQAKSLKSNSIIQKIPLSH